MVWRDRSLSGCMDSGVQGRAESQLRSQLLPRGECMRMAGGQLDYRELKLLEIDPGSAVTDVPAPSRIECRLVHVGVEPTGTVNGNTDYWACFD